MAFTTINNGSLYMNTKLYTGTGASNALTGVGFQPDMTWIKNRSGNADHVLFDVIRGATKPIFPNDTNAESTAVNELTSFDSDGFTVGSGGNVNGNGNGIASWNWLANGAGSANTAGSINSTVSANTTAGMSIVKYQGTGANATVGHGLGAVPKMILFKSLTNAISWIVYSSELNISSSNCLRLNGTNAAFTESAWNGTRPTTSVFSLGIHNEANNSSGETIAYCFADVQGYSKFGSYTGNGNADGTFIYTGGMKPAWIMCKKYNVGGNWIMFDNKREPFNLNNDFLQADLSDAEVTGNSTIRCDFVSNGVKLRGTNNAINTSGGSYIYMAFAENPFVTSTGVPATAR